MAPRVPPSMSPEPLQPVMIIPFLNKGEGNFGIESYIDQEHGQSAEEVPRLASDLIFLDPFELAPLIGKDMVFLSPNETMIPLVSYFKTLPLDEETRICTPQLEVAEFVWDPQRNDINLPEFRELPSEHRMSLVPSSNFLFIDTAPQQYLGFVDMAPEFAMQNTPAEFTAQGVSTDYVDTTNPRFWQPFLAMGFPPFLDFEAAEKPDLQCSNNPRALFGQTRCDRCLHINWIWDKQCMECFHLDHMHD